MKIAVVTDSTSDIPADIAAQNGIHVVPNLVTINNVSYLDGEGISREDFYLHVAKSRQLPTTAAPSPEVYTRLYRSILDSGVDQILSFHPARILSALFSVASIAAEPFKEQIQIIDSNSASLGLGFQALHAARAAACGESVQAILDEVNLVKEKVHVFALLDTLTYVRNSGRVHWVTASLASMLGLRAVIEVRKGVVHRLGLARTRAQALNQLNKAARSAGKIREAAFLHTTQPNKDEVDMLLGGLPNLAEKMMMVHITPIIGSHVGPNCVGFALVLE